MAAVKSHSPGLSTPRGIVDPNISTSDHGVPVKALRSNFHHQQLYLRQPEDGTDDDFINDEELNCDPIDPEYILGSPTSEMVRYSQPQFFITDEPESSPFYLNPTIWILAFLCQRTQGFTITRICDLSKFVRKATSIMLTMTPMIHLPTFKTFTVLVGTDRSSTLDSRAVVTASGGKTEIRDVLLSCSWTSSPDIFNDHCSILKV
ncbi:hypothetical protein BY996DRAFT_6410629 [Phakopsora pachyrhizi]|nr:hypothetical protein BY996DRAFT_6410629 [Phakopsora pachyrhizi]